MKESLSLKTINGFSYSQQDVLGRGCSSEVYRAVCSSEQLTGFKKGQQVAIKVLNLQADNLRHNVPMANAQMNALRQLKDCNNVLQLIKAIRSPNNIYLITDYCSKGSLFDLIKSKGKLSQTTAIVFLRQIIRGYQHIANKKLLHRDLKPANIFVNDKEELLIGDFGFAIDSSQCSRPLQQNVGSPLYMPPQTLRYNFYSFKSDIWAIGIIFVQMLTGKTPWKSKSEKQLVYQMSTFLIEDIMPPNVSNSSKQFLKQILNRNLDQRMSLQQLIEFDFQEEASPERKNNLTMDRKLNLSRLKGCQSMTNFIQINIKPPNAKSNIFLDSKEHLNPIIQNEQEKDQKEDKKQKEEKAVVRKGQLKTKNRVVQRKTSLESNFTFQAPTMKSIVLTKNKVSVAQPRSQIATAQSSANLKQSTKNQSTQPSPLKNNPIKSSPVKQRRSLAVAAPIKERIEKNEIQMKRTYVYSPQAKQTTMTAQIESQINYVRFMCKLLKKMNDIIKGTDQKIQNFKAQLVYHINQKMQQILQIRYIEEVVSKKNEFLLSKAGSMLSGVIANYKEKYLKQFEDSKINAVWIGDKQFMASLTQILNKFYQRVEKVECDQQSLRKMKSLVGVVEGLAGLSRLFLLDSEKKWQMFNWKTEELLLQKKRDGIFGKEEWEYIKTKCFDLTKT